MANLEIDNIILKGAKTDMKRLLIVIIVIILAGCAFTNFERNLLRAADSQDAAPIFDGDVGNNIPKLRFRHCKSDQVLTNEGGHVILKKDNKKFKSKKVVKIEESWDSRDFGLVIIKRYYCDTPEDAVLYPFIMPLSMNPFNLPGGGWTPYPNRAYFTKIKIGENTAWTGQDSLYFTKGNVLVTVRVNPDTLGPNYTEIIARKVEKKL